MKVTASQTRQRIIDWKCHANNPSQKWFNENSSPRKLPTKINRKQERRSNRRRRKKYANNTFRWSLVKYVRPTFPRCFRNKERKKPKRIRTTSAPHFDLRVQLKGARLLCAHTAWQNRISAWQKISVSVSMH